MEKINIVYPFNNISALEWACRRGMLELDVLLGNFLKEKYTGLAIEQKQLFIQLINHTDPELFSWLMGHENPQDQGIAQITEIIRHHARSRVQYSNF